MIFSRIILRLITTMREIPNPHRPPSHAKQEQGNRPLHVLCLCLPSSLSPLPLPALSHTSSFAFVHLIARRCRPLLAYRVFFAGRTTTIDTSSPIPAYCYHLHVIIPPPPRRRPLLSLSPSATTNILHSGVPAHHPSLPVAPRHRRPFRLLPHHISCCRHCPHRRLIAIALPTRRLPPSPCRWHCAATIAFYSFLLLSHAVAC